jgi:hypothetical protein
MSERTEIIEPLLKLMPWSDLGCKRWAAVRDVRFGHGGGLGPTSSGLQQASWP